MLKKCSNDLQRLLLLLWKFESFRGLAPMAKWLKQLISLPLLIVGSSHHCVQCGFEPKDNPSSACGFVTYSQVGALRLI